MFLSCCVCRVAGRKMFRPHHSAISISHRHSWTQRMSRPPPGFQGVSHWSEFQSGREFDGLAISECVAGCANPFHPDQRIGPRVLAVRDSRFKLMLFFDPPADQLYDLESDPGEKSPLPANTEKPVRRRLLNAAREHLSRSISNRDARSRVQARLRELQLEWKKPADKASPVAS